jgi:hypothetical protein
MRSHVTRKAKQTGKHWVAMLKFHLQYLCIRQPASQSAEEHGKIAGFTILTPANCNYQKHSRAQSVIVSARSPLPGGPPNAMPCHPFITIPHHLQRSAKRKKQRATNEKHTNERTSPEAVTHFLPPRLNANVCCAIS